MSRQQRIETLLVQEIDPSYLQVIDDSMRHRRGQETHFTIILVTEKFSPLTTIARHRMVQKLLADELATGLHAISLQLFSPEEWSARSGKITPPPACRGGEHIDQ